MRRDLQDSSLNVEGGPVPHNVVLNQNGFISDKGPFRRLFLILEEASAEM